MNKLKSIYIDTEKGLVVINGEPVERVSHLCIEADGRKWSLAISKTEKYEAPKIDNQNFRPGTISATRSARYLVTVASSFLKRFSM